ncbi:MAG TPA: sulfurtransferase [Bacteroidota bacterium]|jgi:thiosulfate/3-mercaptopyruvate sulfurtransferase|nr:sulfurtransferase [Bacteroidota bacterium]
MKHRLHVFALVAGVIFFMSNRIVHASDDKSPVLVSPQWLAAHLNDPDLIVLNVAQNARFYRAGHIPGARFLWVTWLAAPNPELSFELVPVEQLDTIMESLGITNDSRIVLCSVNGNVSPTARAYITLEYLGMGDRTSILDGGFEAWKAAGNPVSKEVPSHKRGSFTPHLKSDAIVNVDYVKSHMNTTGVTLLDARAPEFYNGVGGGFPRPGRIPGAVNLFFNTLFDTSNKYLPLDSIKVKFATAGIKPEDDVITYCHVGQTASADYIAAKLLGHAVHLYDGSFEDWSGREELPVYLEAKKDSSKK